MLYICIYVAPWSCEAQHLVPLYVHTCSGMTIKLNLTWLDLTWLDLTWLPHTKHKIKPSPGPFSSTVVAPPFILPELLNGTRDRWVEQSTGLTPLPRLSAPPHSSQWSTGLEITDLKQPAYFAMAAIGLHLDTLLSEGFSHFKMALNLPSCKVRENWKVRLLVK